jgi:hypothetical protein
MVRTRESTIIGQSPHKAAIEELLCRVNKAFPYHEVSRVIKEKYGMDIKARTLQYYRNTYITAPQIAQEAIKAAGQTINFYNEMLGLYNMQKERVQIDTKLEKDMNKLLKDMNKEVELMLKILTEIKATSFEMGLVEKKADKVEYSGPVSTILLQGLTAVQKEFEQEQKLKNGTDDGESDKAGPETGEEDLDEA